MKFFVVTLFEELFRPWIKEGLVGQAHQKNLFSFETLNPRVFTTDVHHSVDDKVYGGGDGMVASFPAWAKAIENLKAKSPQARIVFLTPQGTPWSQSKSREWLSEPQDTILICGRYGGFDERLVAHYADEEISIGDYVLNGGEIPAMVVMETVIRGIPEVLGRQSSYDIDSFGEDGLLECPTFTRPQVAEGLSVPEFLLSGHHQNIEKMKKAISLVRTHKKRPDIFQTLLSKHKISKEQLEEALRLVENLSESDRKLLGV